jgi:hypothetical protein
VRCGELTGFNYIEFDGKGKEMDLTKRYKDIDGNDCDILDMINRHPEWAAERIQIGEKAIEKLEKMGFPNWQDDKVVK